MRILPHLILLALMGLGLAFAPPPVGPERAEADPFTTGAAAAQVAVSLPDIFGIDLDDVLAAGGIVYVVNEFGDEINDGINALLNNNNAATGAATKVVVIVTPQGKHIGAAQVTGPRAAVDRVNAVAQLEDDFQKLVRFRVLIPVEAEDFTSLQRIKGVAVSALIDLKL